MALKKCVFLDIDGVLNIERGEYTFRLEDFELEYKIPETINKLHLAGFILVIITNQAGIAKGLYTKKDVFACHNKLQQECGNKIQALYYSPYHPDYTESLSRKPGTLMFERAIHKFSIDPSQSFMVGDKVRDLIPAKKLGIKTVLVNNKIKPEEADHLFENLYNFSLYLLNH